MAALAEFERDLLRERVRSGIAAAQKRGVVFGRRPGQRVKADRFAPRVLKLVSEGRSYRGNQPPTWSQQEYRSRHCKAGPHGMIGHDKCGPYAVS
ncbi:MAG TPA: recombinase family protein [Steroidobacteraceae bacterium]|nr:recombinase family protein [Steroidobacteraceae bacterium]